MEKQLLWDICCKITNKKLNKIKLGGTGEEVRDWLHVLDAAKLVWMARDECSKDCHIINGGSGISTSIKEIAELTCQSWDESISIEYTGVARDGDPHSLVADISKSNKLGFKPSISINDGITKTVKWYKNTYGGINH